MATIIIQIPDAVMPRVVAGLCGQGGYQDTIDEAPNPETRGQFAKRFVLEWIRHEVVQWEAKIERDNAWDTQKAQSETDLVGMS